MNVDVNELIVELERQFPKELTICLQAVQIRKLQQEINNEQENIPATDD